MTAVSRKVKVFEGLAQSQPVGFGQELPGPVSRPGLKAAGIEGAAPLGGPSFFAAAHMGPVPFNKSVTANPVLIKAPIQLI